MTTIERRTKPEARLKTPEVPLDARPVAWRDMSTAPRDGGPVWLRGQGHVMECFWRITRKFQDGGWKPTGFWSRFGGNPHPINFEPSGWYRQTTENADGEVVFEKPDVQPDRA